ncbi:MAG: hypothetical protein ABIE94_03835 [archaeon]
MQRFKNFKCQGYTKEMEEVNRHKLGILYAVIIFIMLFILVLNTPATVLPKEPNFHTQLTGMVIGSDQTFVLSSNDKSDPLSLSSLRLSGEIYGSGDVNVRLRAEAPGWQREYLVFSNRKMVLKNTEGLAGITAFVVNEPGPEIQIDVISPPTGVTRSGEVPVKVYYRTLVGNINRIELYIGNGVYEPAFPENSEGYAIFNVKSSKYLNGEYNLYAKIYVETIEQQLGGYPFPTITIKKSNIKTIIFDNEGVEEKPEDDDSDDGTGIVALGDGKPGPDVPGTNQTNGTETPPLVGDENTSSGTTEGGDPSDVILVVPIVRELLVNPILNGQPAEIEEVDGLKLVGMSISDLPFDPIGDSGETFENECLETCLLEKSPSNETNYTLSINITNGTYLKLGNIIYLEYKKTGLPFLT